MKRRIIITGLAILSLAVFTGKNLAAERLSGKVTIDGSSTVYPITAAVAEEFSKDYPRVRVTVGISGTGGGFKRFVVGETDISNASRAIKSKEYEASKKGRVDFIEIPVAYDGLSIVVNPDNGWARDLTVADLQKIFLEGEGNMAKTWKDVRSEWPAEPIKIYAPGTDSGTFDYFKEVVAGKTGQIRGDMSVSEDDNVLVRGVAGDRGAIGFFGVAYYVENKDKVRAVPIINGAGKPVMPQPEYIEDGSYEPFSRPLLIYVSARSARRPEVTAFVKYYFEHGPELVEEVGYVRLPSEIYARAMKKFTSRSTGTHYLDSNLEKVEGNLFEVYR